MAGGGIGAVEAALALRALAGDRVDVELVAPGDEMVYRPMTVAEPFGHAAPCQLPLARLGRTHGIRWRRDWVRRVDPERSCVHLGAGDTVPYDFLVVATGARPARWLPDALTFTGEREIAGYRALLTALQEGEVGRVVFAAPAGAAWTLPLYELALLTAGWAADHEVIGAELEIVTPESEPLGIFGPAAARAICDLLGDRGVRLRRGLASAIAGGRLHLADGGTIAADRVVALPRIAGRPLPGLPADGEGCIAVDDHAAVAGLDGVFAVGDATAFPVKQGGLAAQQADAAAAAIAARAGAPVEPKPFVPMLRGLLLAGVTPVYLQARLGHRASSERARSTVAFDPLWSPPTKVAGRYLSAYLADQSDPLESREPAQRAARPLEQTGRDREQLRNLALTFARTDAQWGDHRSALRWLEVLEWLEGPLPPGLAELRARWERDPHLEASR